MGIDYQVGFNLLIVLAAFLGGWILKGIARTVERLDADVRSLPNQYVTRLDYHRDIDDVKAALLRIEQKLDGKADKTH